jgi:hypothetical protein
VSVLRTSALLALAVCFTVGGPSAPSLAQARCWGYAEGDKLGKMDADRIDEASGIAASLWQPGVYWVHNDSGDDERIFAVSEDGDYYGQWKVRDADADDWEDIAVGPCADGWWTCLFIADLGNNDGKRKSFTLYRVLEPEVDTDKKKAHDAKTEDADAFEVIYPGDDAPDVEAIFVDDTGAVYLATKWYGGVTLFRVDIEHAEDGVAFAIEVGAREDVRFVTGADMAPDGGRFILRSHETAWEFYLLPGESVAEAFRRTPMEIELRSERQGEAIGYDADSFGFLTTSERKNRPLYWYACRSFDGPIDDSKADGSNTSATPADTGCHGSSNPGWACLALMLAWAIVRRRGVDQGRV